MVDVEGGENEHLARLDRLYAKVTAICGAESILLEAELVLLPLLVVDQGCHVDHDVFRSEVLLARDAILESFARLPSSEHNRIDDGEHLILHVRHDKGADPPDRQVKAVNRITFVVEVRRFGVELLFEPGAHPGNEVTIDVDLLENFKILKAILMNLFTNLEPKVQWKLLNKLVQTRIARLCIVLECFADVIVEER